MARRQACGEFGDVQPTLLPSQDEAALRLQGANREAAGEAGHVGMRQLHLESGKRAGIEWNQRRRWRWRLLPVGRPVRDSEQGLGIAGQRIILPELFRHDRKTVVADEEMQDRRTGRAARHLRRAAPGDDEITAGEFEQPGAVGMRQRLQRRPSKTQMMRPQPVRIEAGQPDDRQIAADIGHTAIAHQPGKRQRILLLTRGLRRLALAMPRAAAHAAFSAAVVVGGTASDCNGSKPGGAPESSKSVF